MSSVATHPNAAPLPPVGARDWTELKALANQVRIDIIRGTHAAGSGHPGTSLSTVELLTALFFGHAKIGPTVDHLPDSDRFVMSKGHGAPGYYAQLAAKGYLPREELLTLRKVGSRLQGHPNLETPGVWVCTGSLGNGIAQAAGLAMAAKIDGHGRRVFTMVGDGECQEGLVWEAAMSAAHYGLDNFRVIMDHNKLQIDGPVKEVMDLGAVVAKWTAFGFKTFEIDGHDFDQILDAYRAADAVKGQPVAIVAHTTKGKGVSFMEGKVEWHGVAPNNDEAAKALREIGGDAYITW
jgi:transketolase